jgi:Zn-dependent protease with chaperone function
VSRPPYGSPWRHKTRIVERTPSVCTWTAALSVLATIALDIPYGPLAAVGAYLLFAGALLPGRKATWDLYFVAAILCGCANFAALFYGDRLWAWFYGMSSVVLSTVGCVGAWSARRGER